MRKLHRLGHFALIFALGSAQYAHAVTDKKRPVTVIDGINRTQLYDVTPRETWFDIPTFVPSPDRSKIFVITGTGDAKALTHRFKLLMFSTDDLVQYVRGKQRSAPKPKTLAELDYSMSSRNFGAWEAAGIRDVTFYNQGQNLIFLGADSKGIYQIFTVDLRTERVTQISRSSTDVVAYRVFEKTGDVFYSAASATLQDTHCQETDYSHQELSVFRGFCLANGVSWADIEANIKPYHLRSSDLYRQSLRGDTPATKLLANFVPVGTLSRMVLSDNGKRAIVRVGSHTPPEPYRRSFEQSKYYKARIAAASARKGFNPDIMDVETPYAYYGVLDLEKATFKPFIDLLSGRSSNDAPRWIDDERIYLPQVEQIPAATAPLRLTSTGSTTPSGMIVNLRTGEYADAPTRTSSGQTTPAPNTLIQRYEELRKTNYVIDEDDTRRRCVANQYAEDMTTDGLPGCFLELRKFGLIVMTDEHYNRPPNIVAMDARTKKKKLVLELNPQFRDIEFAKIEELQWKDEHGDVWKGALLLPRNYRPGKRYPLIVQTEGYDPNRFIFNGTHFTTAPHAAQAFAGRDIAVLLLGHRYDEKVTNPQQILLARGINSGIRHLNQRGLVDLTRIGMIGFSGYARLTFQMAAFPEFPLAAIMVADGASPSPMGYFLQYKHSYPGMWTQESEYCRAMPWGDTQAEWIKRNPFYRLDKINTAVHISKFSGNLNDWLDIYAGLRRLGKPAEMQQINAFGQHPTTIPEAILVAQQTAIDWFDFWLNGRESQDPAKAEQYERWRRMRAQMPSSAPSAEPVTPYSRMDCPETGSSPTASTKSAN